VKVSDLVGLDRILENVRVDLGSDEADREISALFGELRDELGEVERGECGPGDSTDIDEVWGY
jgi:hypothetical protein